MSDVMDARRKAFEEWWNAPEQSELRKSCAQGWGEYIWNAALDSVCVHLPKVKEVSGYSEEIADAMGFNDALEYCREAIEREGLKVKP